MILKWYFLLVVVLITTGCMWVVPKKIEYYDEECQIFCKKVVLTLTQRGLLDDVKPGDSCADEACADMFFLEKVFSVSVSAIVSGSIAIVGNTVYWLEKQGNCNREVTPQKEDNIDKVAVQGN